jgi:hypothetical protein
MRKVRLLAAAPLALVLLTGLAPPPPPPEAAEAEPAAAEEPAPAEAAKAAALRPALGTELFLSSDSDGTRIARTALDFDLRDLAGSKGVGVRVERAHYDPSGRGWEHRDRVFVKGAAKLGDWQLRARVGTDGDEIIGAVSLNDEARFRKEVFVERDLVETRQGLDLGLYSTFAGAAIDLPADDRNVFTALAGLQAFTGDNVRTHLRASYIHVVEPELGLSAQLRARWFRSSDPGEYDYYSPRWYAEVLPTVQMRRFTGGWELVGAAGLGLQRDSATDWRASRYAHARFRSPAASSWSVNGALTYTNTPSLSGTPGSGYSYVQATLGLSKRF